MKSYAVDPTALSITLDQVLIQTPDVYDYCASAILYANDGG